MTVSPSRTINMNMARALREALREEMRRDPNVFCIGQDIGIPGGPGGAWAVAWGLEREFGQDRIRPAPISESAMVGAAIGAALMGMRPVVDVSYVDFFFCAMDQIVNQAATIGYMSGGQYRIPLVLRGPVGATTRGAQHGHSPESFYFHVPGLKIVCPASPYDAKGLLKTAIRDDSPVFFFEHKLLYGAQQRKGPRSLAVTEEVPTDDYTIPFGSARIRRQGEHVTVLATLLMAHLALAAAEQLASGGISAEVIDPRTLVPFDWETLQKSLAKTGHLVIVHEDTGRGGWGAEIAARIHADCPDLLRKPVLRITAPDTPAPCAPNLENAYVPGPDRIAREIRQLLEAPAPRKNRGQTRKAVK